MTSLIYAWCTVFKLEKFALVIKQTLISFPLHMHKRSSAKMFAQNTAFRLHECSSNASPNWVLTFDNQRKCHITSFLFAHFNRTQSAILFNL